jgi:glycosyltransferase involved in cell wall biosynthesis
MALIANALDRRRFEPHVASVLGGFHADRLRLAGVPVLTLPIRSYLRPGTASIALTLRRYIRKKGIRLVHTFDYTMSLFGVPIARTCGAVVALSSQRFYMEAMPRKYRSALFLTHRLADGVVTNCIELQRHLCIDWRYPAARIQVCYNGLDTTAFSPAARRRIPGLEGADMVIGTVCVLRPEKNVSMLIEAFPGEKYGSPEGRAG